ncbi:MAG TPA: thioredoxin family protein [Oculatellaceae cyanobacterium]
MPSKTNPPLPLRILRLIAFAAICCLLGLGVLVGMCAPLINPSFLDNFLFRQAFSEKEQRSALLISSESEKKYLTTVFAGLEQPLVDADFARLTATKPEDVYFKASDGLKLHGWFFKTPGATDTVLFNWSGLCDTRLPVLLGYVKMLQDSKHSVLLYDYRGFGKSEGKPSLPSTISDGEAAYTYLTDGRHLKPEDIILMGRTVGAHVACELSSKHKCKAMILEEPWTNVKDFVDAHPMAIGSRLVPSWLYPGDAYDNTKFLKGEHPPLLIVGYSSHQAGPLTLYEQTPMPKNYLQLMELTGFIFPNLPEQSQRYTERLSALTGKAIKAKMTPAPSSGANGSKHFEWQRDLTAALAQAKSENKSVLVDVYTDWCGPCRLLDQRTYSDPRVQSLLANSFITVKANAEDSGKGQDIAQRYEVHAYPTIILVDNKGKVFGRFMGFMFPDDFLRVMRAFSL